MLTSYWLKLLYTNENAINHLSKNANTQVLNYRPILNRRQDYVTVKARSKTKEKLEADIYYLSVVGYIFLRLFIQQKHTTVQVSFFHRT